MTVRGLGQEWSGGHEVESKIRGGSWPFPESLQLIQPWASSWASMPKEQAWGVFCRASALSPRPPTSLGPGLEKVVSPPPHPCLWGLTAVTAPLHCSLWDLASVWVAWGARGPVVLGTCLFQQWQLGVWGPICEGVANWDLPPLSQGWVPWRVRAVPWDLVLSCQDREQHSFGTDLLKYHYLTMTWLQEHLTSKSLQQLTTPLLHLLLLKVFAESFQ